MASKIPTNADNPSSSKPTQRELDSISKSAGDNWRSLLTNLGLDLDVIMGYHNKYNGNTVNVCFEGLVFWVKGNTEEPVSYETLVKALKDANLTSCATTLEEKQRETLLRLQQTDNQQQDGDLVPTVCATQGETTPVTSTTEERSQDKIKKIVEMYRSGDCDVHVPEIPDLERDFQDLMAKLDHRLASADLQMMLTIHSNVQMEYRTYIYETPSGLYDFIAAKSTPYEVPLVSCAVQVLKVGTLTKTFQAYKSKLADRLRGKLHSCKMKNVKLPKRKDCTHLAAVVSRDKDLVLISFALHIKEYLMKNLQLEEAVFEGFGEGCTVLFFSILTIDAALLPPKILSHSAELKKSFDITHLVFDYFVCDLERGIIEQPSTSQRTEPVLQIKNIKQEMLCQFELLQTSKESAKEREQLTSRYQEELKKSKDQLENRDISLQAEKEKCCRLEWEMKQLHEEKELLETKIRHLEEEVRTQQMLRKKVEDNAKEIEDLREEVEARKQHEQGLNRQLQRALEEKRNDNKQLKEHLAKEIKLKEELEKENLTFKQIIEQFQVDFNAERKDKQGVAVKLANREKEWKEKMRKVEEERDQLKAVNMQLQDQTAHQLEQFKADFDAERKDREEAADKFADREKEWMEKIEKAEEERDQLKALNMRLRDQTSN